MKTKILLFGLLAVFLLGNIITKAQTNTFPSTGNAGIGTLTPLASAALEIKSTTKGLLIPRMTKTQRDAVLVSTSATALLIYQTDNTPGFYYYTGSSWVPVSSLAGANTSLSNLASATAINHSLTAGINNSLSLGSSTIGWKNLYINNAVYLNGHSIFSTPFKTSVAIGISALHLNPSVDHLIAIGDSAFFSNTTGARGTAVGALALYKNTTGDNNTAIGYQTLYNNTSGTSNVGQGLQVLYGNTTGNNNVAVGAKAMNANTTGYSNIGIGIKTLYNSTTGNQSIAIGDSALYNFNYNYFPNIAIGSKALYTSTTATDNVALGYQALYNTTTGGDNVAIGYALRANTTGGVNIGIGYNALGGNTTGLYNVATGNAALTGNTTGNYNTCTGIYTLVGNNTGSYNSAFGYDAGVNADGYTNATALGYAATATASNQVMLGNSSVTAVEAYGPYYNLSDGRIKKNIKENVPGLAFINSLRPVTYNYDLHGANDKTGITEMQNKMKTDNKVSASAKSSASGASATSAADKANDDAISAKEKIQYTGFVAQEVETAAKKLNYDFSGIHTPANDKDLYALSYSDFVVPLVKAVQELSKQNDEKDSALQQQQQVNANLQNQINQLKAMIVSSANGNQSIVVSSASLAQNVPNPFSSATSISYNIPQTAASAYIILSDKKGVMLKQVNINTKGKGNINIDASTLSNGAYQYSLIVDGRMVDTKQMLLSR